MAVARSGWNLRGCAVEHRSKWRKVIDLKHCEEVTDVSEPCPWAMKGKCKSRDAQNLSLLIRKTCDKVRNRDDAGLNMGDAG